jgi:transposase-like protein
MRVRGEATLLKWRGLIAEQARSGQSVAAFCRERGLGPTHFFAWKKRLSQVGAEHFVEVQVLPSAEPAQPTTPHNQAIEIRLGGGRSVLVEPGFDAHHLRAVLAALEMRP